MDKIDRKEKLTFEEEMNQIYQSRKRDYLDNPEHRDTKIRDGISHFWDILKSISGGYIGLKEVKIMEKFYENKAREYDGYFNLNTWEEANKYYYSDDYKKVATEFNYILRCLTNPSETFQN